MLDALNKIPGLLTLLYRNSAMQKGIMCLTVFIAKLWQQQDTHQHPRSAASAKRKYQIAEDLKDKFSPTLYLCLLFRLPLLTMSELLVKSFNIWLLYTDPVLPSWMDLSI